MAPQRIGTVRRETKETQVAVEVSLDGAGSSDIATSIGMLDHLLEQIPRHGLFDITIKASGDIDRDPHHLIEDIGMRPIWVGENDKAHLVDALGLVWLTLVTQRKMGDRISFKILQHE